MRKGGTPESDPVHEEPDWVVVEKESDGSWTKRVVEDARGLRIREQNRGTYEEDGEEKEWRNEITRTFDALGRCTNRDLRDLHRPHAETKDLFYEGEVLQPIGERVMYTGGEKAGRGYSKEFGWREDGQIAREQTTIIAESDRPHPERPIDHRNRTEFLYDKEGNYSGKVGVDWRDGVPGSAKPHGRWEEASPWVEEMMEAYGPKELSGNE